MTAAPREQGTEPGLQADSPPLQMDQADTEAAHGRSRSAVCPMTCLLTFPCSSSGGRYFSVWGQHSSRRLNGSARPPV